MKKVYIFRHGETEYNRNGVRTGIHNIPLNDTGRQQAAAIGEILKDAGIQHIYSSYMDRARETGRIVGGFFGIEDAEVFPDLHEIDAGLLNGKSKDCCDGLPENFGELYCDINAEVHHPEGESKLESRERFCRAISRICARDRHDVIGIAAHGFVIRQLLMALGFEDCSGLSNCEAVECEYDEESREIKVIRRIRAC